MAAFLVAQLQPIDPVRPADYLPRMALRPIIILPDPKLRLKSAPVERVDGELLKLADDMLETMYDAPGIGLAAIQIAVPRRLVVIDTSRNEDERAPMVFINPEIVWSSDERSVYEEGCLSIPEYYAEVERPAKVRVAYVDRDGKGQEIEADGLLATCLQHEIDHLDGVLFVDHLSKLKRSMVIRKFSKAAKRDPGESDGAERPKPAPKPRPAPRILE
jgi:peptide deformylase